MGILPSLLWVFLNLLCIGLDIAIFFVLVRIILMWRNIQWLERLNNTGRELVDAINSNISQFWYRVTQKQLSDRGKRLSASSVYHLLSLWSVKSQDCYEDKEDDMKAATVINSKTELLAVNAIKMHLRLLRHKGFGVTELRIFDPVPMVAYADNEDDAVRLVFEMEERASGIYVGVQPRPIHLYDLAPNCWQPARSKPNSNCACDKDIEYIANSFGDIDVISPQRSAGHPASEEELQQSLQAARLLCQQDGLALSSTICCSGNGHYILAPIVPIPVYSKDRPSTRRTAASPGSVV